MLCDVIRFLSNKLCVFLSLSLARGYKTHKELDKNHIASQKHGKFLNPLTMLCKVWLKFALYSSGEEVVNVFNI
jgi:hypothetical protein